MLEVASLTQHRAFSVIARVAAAMDADPGQFERICERLSRRTHILHPGTLEELPDGTISPFYEFAHALYREVLYNRIPPGRRARLHRQAAQWAEAAFAEQPSEAAPFLAYHFEHGGDSARAVRYLRVAADTAGRRYAPREATAHLRHALELCTGLPGAERATNELAVLEQLAAMYVVSFDTLAVETYEALAARAAASGLIDLEVKALVDMAYPLSWTGRFVSAPSNAIRPGRRGRARAVSCGVSGPGDGMRGMQRIAVRPSRKFVEAAIACWLRRTSSTRISSDGARLSTAPLIRTLSRVLPCWSIRTWTTRISALPTG